MARDLPDKRRLETLADLYAYELRDLHGAERIMLEGLGELSRATRTPALRKTFEDQRDHVEERLARLARLIGPSQRDGGGGCPGMEGIVAGCEALIRAGAARMVLDAGFIVAAQKMMHYAIAGYGSARTFAGTLGDNKAHLLLQESLNDVADADRALTKLAEDVVNLQAAEPEPAALARGSANSHANSHVEDHDGEKIR